MRSTALGPEAESWIDTIDIIFSLSSDFVGGNRAERHGPT